ncbi:MAG: hypothetical protein DHS20C02_14380 [Micavibrio sp.]|nr:MAG: hypothetical protein DHS20C02_14380 [Micavibrio sp.]
MIRSFLLSLALIAAFMTVLPQSGSAGTERIAAVVNEDAITVSDVNDRLRLIIGSAGLPNSNEIREKLKPQVMSALIEERLKFQEARRLDIIVEQEEIDQAFASIAAQNNIPADKFAAMLKGGGINPDTMKKQLESQIIWSKVVQQLLRPRVLVSDADIDSFIERLQQSTGKKEYLVAEIFLPVEQPSEENNVKQLASKLVGQIKSGKAPFYKLAQQFSKSAGSAQGGDMGWVQQGQLPEELDQALLSVEKNQTSNAIRSLSGYHILFLRDYRIISDENIPSRDEITSRLGTERLERLQRRHLLDLKSTAFIENRAGS